jgi:hypothetical protein
MLRCKSVQIMRHGILRILLTPFVISLPVWAQGPADLSLTTNTADVGGPEIRVDLGAQSVNLQAHTAAAVTSRNSLTRTSTSRSGQSQVSSHSANLFATQNYPGIVAGHGRSNSSASAFRFPRAMPNGAGMAPPGAGTPLPGNSLMVGSTGMASPVGLLPLGPSLLNSSLSSRASSMLSLASQQMSGPGSSSAQGLGAGLGAGLGQGLGAASDTSSSQLLSGASSPSGTGSAATGHSTHGRSASGPGVHHGPKSGLPGSPSSRPGRPTRDQMDADSLGALSEAIRAGALGH